MRRFVELAGALTVVFLLMSCTHLGQVRSDPLVGAWRGVWSKGGDTVSVTVAIEQTPTGYSASFDSEDLELAGIPFSSVERHGETVSLTLEGDSSATAFDGRVSGDELAGVLREGEFAGRFFLRRDPSPLPALATRPVSFSNGDVDLTGTLILPQGDQPHPAIIFLHGSGPGGQGASQYLAQQFARRGFVALIFDKRGVGDSTGDWRRSSFADLAADAASGVRLLRTLPEVDASRVGAYGHSQGSTIAALLAPLAELRFVIASAATGESPAETEIYSVGNSIGLAGLPAEDQADALRLVREIVAVAYDGKSREELDRMSLTFQERPWYFAPPPPNHHYWSLSRLLAPYSPPDAWRSVRAPVLLLWGTQDERVNPAASAEIIVRALRDGGEINVTTRMFDGADHSFRAVDPPVDGGWLRRTPGYVETLLTWAERQTSNP